jgi:hypothetical protein
MKIMAFFAPFSANRLAKPALLALGLAVSSHAVWVHYKEEYFGDDIKKCYQDLYTTLPDTVPVAHTWDSLLAGSPCYSRSTAKLVDCYTGLDNRPMTEQQCCFLRSKGNIILTLADSLEQMRARFSDFNGDVENGKIVESIIIRESNYNVTLFFDKFQRFWKFEVAGGQYPPSHMEEVQADADSLLSFLMSKYHTPTWRADKSKLVFAPNSDAYYANWEFPKYILYLVISSTDSMFSAKEVAMDRKLSMEYEQEMKKEGAVSQTITATPK